MEPWTRMISPLLNVRMPASGDVVMDYKPWTNWGVSSPKAGNPEVEAGVFRDVAMPGKQLGKLTEALDALISIVEDIHPGAIKPGSEQREAIDGLRTMANDIKLKRDELAKTAKAEALDALDRLKRSDREAFTSLVHELNIQNDDKAAKGSVS